MSTLRHFHLELRKEPGWELKVLDQSSGWPQECAIKTGILSADGNLLVNLEGRPRRGSNSEGGSGNEDGESEESECTWEDILEDAKSKAQAALEAKLPTFCDAVRRKSDWQFKILNAKHDLGRTWAVEAGLLPDIVTGDEDIFPVISCIEELKAEALRIRSDDHLIHPHSRSIPVRNIDFDTIDKDVRNALKYARAGKYTLHPPKLAHEVGVYVSDGIVPSSLHRELVTELDSLAAIEPRDFHPGTRGKVQDLIHPSLFPYIAGVSPAIGSAKVPNLPDGSFRTTMTNPSTNINTWSTTFESKYSWIPSIFEVSPDGTDVRIESYINGLGPRDSFPVLYRLIEKVFLLALPHFERTLDFKFTHPESDSVRRWRDRSIYRDGCTESQWKKILDTQSKAKAVEEAKQEEEAKKTEQAMLLEAENRNQFFELNNSVAASQLKGRRLKVIVKAANYVLRPGQEYEGTWHMEGMPHERIVASTIYYYETDSDITEDGLNFRFIRDEDLDFPQYREERHESFSWYPKKEGYLEQETDSDDEDMEDSHDDHPSDWDDSGRGTTENLGIHVLLGSAPTRFSIAEEHHTGRMLSFPNWLQHKVESITNSADPTPSKNELTTAKRKILCFFLVEDSNNSDSFESHGFVYTGLNDLPVLATSDVPFQGQACNIPTLHFLLPIACQRLIGKHLPPELVTHILDTDLGMTRETAEQHRRALMADRTGKRSGSRLDELDEEVEFSLCEH